MSPCLPRPRLVRGLFLSASICGAALSAQAADPPQADALRLRSLAATCATCHGTDGHAVAGAGFEPLAGKPRDELLRKLLAFRKGEAAATVMHQISRGYSVEQLDALATYFSQQR